VNIESKLTEIREQFPILSQNVGGGALVYLDNAATSQKPNFVISAESEYYRHDNANIHRAPHELGERATAAYEGVREKVRTFINARTTGEIIFTKGTTDAVNLVSLSLSRFHYGQDDEILLTELEHHSNIVPWQLAAERVGAKVIAAKVTPEGEIDLEDFSKKLNERTKVVSFGHVSNALGTVHPVRELIVQVRERAKNAYVFIDGAQWVAHAKTDVLALDADFYAFSAHKLYGPTGVGVLYGKQSILERMPPVYGGGDMIDKVSFSGTTYAPPPHRFEAGTPNIAGVVALGAAIDFFKKYPWKELTEHEERISELASKELSQIEGVRIVGMPKRRMSAISFIVEGMAPMDVAVRLNRYGVAVRAGNHCCMPLMEALGIEGTVRASWSIYTSEEEIRRFTEALRSVVSQRTETASETTKILFSEQRAQSPQQALQELRELFISAGESRSELLLELGAAHLRQLAVLRQLTPQVQGCASEVRFITRKTPEGRLEIASDSNTEIVRGLLSIVERVFSGQKLDDLKAFQPEKLFTELDLPGFVSMQRRTGLESVLKLVAAAVE